MDVAREGTMNEDANNRRRRGTARNLPVVERGRGRIRKRKGDLVVDLSGVSELDLSSLALLLTAQQKAEKEDRSVWLAGVPLQIWQALNAMGLGHLFQPFPVSGKVAV